MNTVPLSLPARQRLLTAAENILLNEGFHALTTRAICRAAETNVSQISYYFGGLEGLLDALLGEELQAVSRAFGVLDLTAGDHDLRSLMTVLLAALQTPAPYTPEGFAALAIEAIHQHVSGEMKTRAAATLNAAHVPFRAALADQLPGMDDLTIRIRLTGVITLAMGMLPRNTGRRLLAMSLEGRDVSEARILDDVLQQCIAVWR